MLGVAAFVLGLLSLPVGLLALLGLPLALLVCSMAAQDQAEMENGVMDPTGWKDVQTALRYGGLAAALCLCGGLLCIPLWAFMVWRTFS